MKFIHYNGKIVNASHIKEIDTFWFLDRGYIHLRFNDQQSDCVEGIEAINIIMNLCPAFLEGKQFKFLKNSWMIHNLIGHPLMQLCSWLRFPALGIKIHDVTIPKPIVK